MGSLDLTHIHRFDSERMLEKILGLPEQLQHAQEIARATAISLKKDRIDNVVVTGMGGSAIGGDIVKAFLGATPGLPVLINRHYRLPGFVNKNSLVIVCSYSGNTEETLACYDEAVRREAQIVCISSGGALTEKATQHQQPIFRIPGGFPPRAAIGYLMLPILYSVSFAGIVDNFEPDIKEAVDVLRTLKDEFHPDQVDNEAKRISLKLKNRVPLIYASTDGFDIVAQRWKGQLSENAKVLAFCNSFPELNHNEIMGWGPLQDINERFQVIYLQDREDHDRIRQRMAITGTIIEKHTNPVIEVSSRGETRLARLFSLIFLGDMVSLYLAILNEVDPTNIENINFLKEELQK